jgi:hypothetical protein
MVFSRIYSKVSIGAGAVSSQAFYGAPVPILLFTIGLLPCYGFFLETLGFFLRQTVKITPGF